MKTNKNILIAIIVAAAMVVAIPVLVSEIYEATACLWQCVNRCGQL